MGRFSNEATNILTSNNITNIGDLITVGRPVPGSKLELIWMDYYDTLIPLAPNTPLAAAAWDANLFPKGGTTAGYARNLNLPFASAQAFFAFLISFDLDVQFNTAANWSGAGEAVPPSAFVDAAWITTLIDTLLMASRVEINIDDKQYHFGATDYCTNIFFPKFLDNPSGSLTPFPIPIPANQYRDHHRTGLTLDPPVIFTSVGATTFNYACNVAGWYKDLFGTNVVPIAPPYDMPINIIARVHMDGCLLRNVK